VRPVGEGPPRDADKGLEETTRFSLLIPNRIRQFGRRSGKNGVKITTAIEDAKDRYGIGGDQERNHRAAFETENP
jgi:hypothetical protein